MGTFSNTGNLIAQSTDPGAVGAGALWSDTDAKLLKRRKDDNSGWDEVCVFGAGTEQTGDEFVQINAGGTSIETVAKTSFTNAFTRLSTGVTSSASSITYDPTDLSGDDYSGILVIASGDIADTTATLNLDMSGFDNWAYDFVESDGTTAGGGQAAGAANIELLAAADHGANENFVAQIMLTYDEANDIVSGFVNLGVENTDIVRTFYIRQNTSVSGSILPSITLSVSAGNFADNTRMDVFGINRQ